MECIKNKSILLILISIAVWFPTFVQAVPIQKGDVFAGSKDGMVEHYRPGVGFLAEYNIGGSGEVTGMAFDSNGNLYATRFGFSTIVKLDNTGNVISNPFVANDTGSHNESIFFDKTGNFYVGQADGTRDIIKRASDGTFIDRYDVATDRGSDWIDLSSDQATMFYSSEGRAIRRYDVSTDTQLANFATLPGSGNAFALRLLDDGGLLVADRNDIKRLDSNGNVVQTYDTNTENFWFALNLDPDGKSFWSAGYQSGLIQRFDIATGNLLDSFTSQGPSGPSGLVVFGEITQGGGGNGGNGGNPIPEPFTLSLFLIGLIGLWSVNRR
ncbi:MAG: hypothetical protein H6937_05330 [Burkholderiales bacterium]|nr:hypothetical protein [Burkholderiales bacterium]MDR4517220.1 hypothetical protein [Nitrosomonas sp.]